MELVQIVMKKHGMTEGQAKALLGIIFKRSKSKLSSADFAKIAAIVPDIDMLLKAAPQQDVPMQSTWALKLVPTILSFVQSKGGDGPKDLLDKSLLKT